MRAIDTNPEVRRRQRERERKKMDEFDQKYGSATTLAGQDLPVAPASYRPPQPIINQRPKDTILTSDANGRQKKKKAKGVSSPDFAQTATQRKTLLGT